MSWDAGRYAPRDAGRLAPTLARMCGRYAASKATDELLEELEIQVDHTGIVPPGLLKTSQQPPPGEPDYNMAPTKRARVALTRAPQRVARTTSAADLEPVRQLRLLTWGLVPSWSKDSTGAVRMINARVESVFDKPAYRTATAVRRALVPASGWYEWQVSPVATDAKGKPRKQPFFVTRADGASCAFAGLYEFWRDPCLGEGDPAAWLTTFTIITQAAEAGLDRVHQRQPLVLERDRWAAWLDPSRTARSAIEPLVRADPPGRFVAYPVTRAVGASAVNGPQLLRPLDREELRGVVDPMTGEIING